MPRYGGKTAFVIQQAIKNGGVILVNREEAKQRILEVAKIMGVEAPRVVVAKPADDTLRGVTFAWAIVDIDVEGERWWTSGRSGRMEK